MYADAEERVVDAAQLLNRLVRLGDEAFDAVGLVAEPAQRRFELRGRFGDTRQS